MGVLTSSFCWKEDTWEGVSSVQLRTWHYPWLGTSSGAQGSKGLAQVPSVLFCTHFRLTQCPPSCVPERSQYSHSRRVKRSRESRGNLAPWTGIEPASHWKVDSYHQGSPNTFSQQILRNHDCSLKELFFPLFDLLSKLLTHAQHDWILKCYVEQKNPDKRERWPKDTELGFEAKSEWL